MHIQTSVVIIAKTPFYLYLFKNRSRKKYDQEFHDCMHRVMERGHLHICI